MSNELVKRAYTKEDLTDEQTEEWIKCALDCEYFIRNYVKVQHTTRGSVKFNLYPYQKRVLDDILKEANNIILQPRQSGKSTVITAYILWRTTFNRDIKVGVAAHKGSGAKEIIARFKYAYEFLPMWMKAGVKSYNVFDVEFDNGSSIISQTTTETTFRGLSMTMIFLDELGYVKPRIAEEFWTSLLPATTAGGDGDEVDEDGNKVEPVKVIITSTPNGSEGLFARLWFKSQRDPSDSMFLGTRVYNEEVPNRGENFKKKMLKSMSPLKYDQEYNCSFLSNKGTLINSGKLESIIGIDNLNEIKEIRTYTETPFRNRRIGVAIDVAEGIGGEGDYSTIEIFDIDTLEQVGEWDNNELSISNFAKFIIQTLTMIRSYGCRELYYTIESNPIGLSIINLLRNSTASVLDYAEMVSDNNRRGGILTTSKSKSKGCSLLKDLVENDKMTIYSKKLLSELKFFVKKGVSFSAESGMHDDLVMATVIFCNMISLLAKEDEEVHDKINNIDGIDCINEGLLDPMPFIF